MQVCAMGRVSTTLERGMCEPVAVRDGDEVVRELLSLDQRVKEARRVLIIDGEARPRLLAELNRSLEGMGLRCVVVGEGAPVDRPDDCSCAGKGRCKTFADIELLPLVEPHPVERPESSVVEIAGRSSEAIPFNTYVPADVVPAKAPEKPDMAKPINWRRGDIFTENPRFTLIHQRREWVLNTIDVADHESLRGVDVEIQALGTEDTELMSFEQFTAGYVFVRRPQSTAE